MRPVLKIYDQSSFERSDLNGEFNFAISIQNKGSYPAVLRPDFRGRRLNLYFDDVVEGPGAATREDIEALFSFGVEWLAEVRNRRLGSVILSYQQVVALINQAKDGRHLTQLGNAEIRAAKQLRNTRLNRTIFARLGKSSLEPLRKNREILQAG